MNRPAREVVCTVASAVRSTARAVSPVRLGVIAATAAGVVSAVPLVPMPTAIVIAVAAGTCSALPTPLLVRALGLRLSRIIDHRGVESPRP